MFVYHGHGRNRIYVIPRIYAVVLENFTEHCIYRLFSGPVTSRSKLRQVSNPLKGYLIDGTNNGCEDGLMDCGKR